ncbi:MAG: flagellar protein FlgN [Planctomycetota bacterium]|jgi:hypothetical protein
MTMLGREDVARAFTALQKLLAAQLEVQQQLISALEEKREAVRTADIGALEAASLREDTLLRRLQDLEGKRRTLVGGLSQAVSPGCEAPLTLSELIALADEAVRGRLEELAAEMRATAASVRRQSAILRQASDALGRHLGGILQTMHSALSRAGVYGNRGTVAYSAPLDASLDLQS